MLLRPKRSVDGTERRTVGENQILMQMLQEKVVIVLVVAVIQYPNADLVVPTYMLVDSIRALCIEDPQI